MPPSPLATPKLSERSRYTLSRIVDYYKIRGCAPSGEDLANAMGVAPATAWYHINKLLVLGLVAYSRSDRSGRVMPRSVRLTRRGLRVLKAYGYRVKG